MTKVVGLDEFVPDDLVFVFKSKRYRVAGTLDLDTLIRLQHVLVELGEAAEKQQTAAKERQILNRLETESLAVLKLDQPDLEKMPFGTVAQTRLVQAILEHHGFIEPPEDPQVPPPNRAQRRAAPKKSTRSSGSKSSTTSGASRPTKR